VYILVNAVAGVAALYLIRAFGWFDKSSNVTVWRILIASFGAIAFFRSSFFQAKIGGSTVSIGPSTVLGQILDACDRDIDRSSAEKISEIVKGDRLDAFDPTQLMYALPVLCLALMQNFPPGDQAQMASELDKIRGDVHLGAKAQVRALVVQLSKYLGAELVGKVLDNAGTAFERPPSQPVVTGPLPVDEVLAAAKGMESGAS
jgi:hypothetical protein